MALDWFYQKTRCLTACLSIETVVFRIYRETLSRFSCAATPVTSAGMARPAAKSLGAGCPHRARRDRHVGEIRDRPGP
ncbi:hypothetical protein ABLN68_02200, partial [Mycobacterium tuberculosis]